MNATDSGPPEVKVSVAMITYNHEPFIAQAIESVLMQQTEFGVELIVGEDCSSDDTRGIVAEYTRRHPERIHPLWHGHNVGAQANSIAVLNACRGQYVALLEGDDYWTDPYKLQKQVDFLEAHPECSMCSHGYTICFEDGSRLPYVPSPPSGTIFSLENLLVSNFIRTATVMFRRRATQELPDWYAELAMGDWPLHILNARFGDIGYIDSVMAVYRVHPSGMWQSQSHVQRLENELQMYQHLRSYLGVKYQRSIRASMASRYVALAAAYADQQNIGEARKNLRRAVAECPMNELKGLVDVGALGVRLFTPRIHAVLKSIWKSSRADA